MKLKVSHIKELMENFAPVELKESYDNVGLMVGDLESSVTSVLVALDCTLEIIDEAIEKGCNTIVTHHPLLFLKPQSITTDTIQGRKIIKLIKNDINLYSCHTNLDITRGGLNDIITKLLGYKQWDIIEHINPCNNIDNQGIGRIVTLNKPVSLLELCSAVKKALQIEYLRYAGDESMLISKLAIINGSGEDYFKASKKQGADCIITGDTTYHYISEYSEEGIGIIDAGHFETEWPAMKIVAEILQEKIIKLGYNNSVFIAENSKPAYKFI
ncbi:Nif3-like dinuclear metal center hexameric protein [Clostridium sp. SYSU_GA19001]|uniref:Nif3-like dinuclear metal center hexameric protein n=1 Tax=Clostridium caldaquaticum TaxID=2940653 RepID=UPI0020770DA5|nr:Nif3-like dinuclear metal center hexameric protein [Clostridium caldaquaticum]MCM8710431.1 Nif3-like dinuclear metal center hexameric protein [Clostridium caldaquaticum]